MSLTGDTFDFQQGNVVTSSAQLVDNAATVGDVLTVQTDKSIAAAPGGGSLPDPITQDVNVQLPTPVAGETPLAVADDSGLVASWLALNLNNAGGGNVDSILGINGNGTAGIGGFYVNGGGGAYFQVYSNGALEFQPRAAEADATQSFLIHSKTGANVIETRAGGTLGFFNHAPAGQQNVPLTTPALQDVIDALVALGLVEQSD